MRTKYRRFRPKDVSLDKMREDSRTRDEAAPLEYRLGLYTEMDIDAIGIRADLARLFKQGYFTLSEKRAIRRKLEDCPMDNADRKAFERAKHKLINFYKDNAIN